MGKMYIEGNILISNPQIIQFHQTQS